MDKPHTLSSGSDFEASLESLNAKLRKNKRNGGNDASGAFTMPVSKKKKVSKAYDPKRLNRTDYSNPAGILDAYLTKGNVSNDKNVIQRGNKALQGKTKNQKHKYKHSYYRNKQPASTASFKDCFEQENISSPKQYQTEEKKKKRLKRV